MKKNKIIILFLILSINSFCQKQINPYVLSDSIYKRQKLLFEISCNYRQYEIKKNYSTGYFLVSILMAPCFIALQSTIKDKDKFGTTVYGSYCFIDLWALTMCVSNEIGAIKIKNRKFKNKTK